MAFLKEKLGSGPCIGTLVGIDSADVAEILALVGYDWLFVDLEHSTLGLDGLKHILRAAKAARADCAVLARVPLNDEVWHKRALDAGCDGVIIPQINSAEAAKKAVAWTKYRPLGERGVGLGRAQGFGAHFKEYIAGANAQVMTVLQIEHSDAVKAAEAIASVPGVDALFVGPYDLSDSMDLRGEIDHPKVKEAMASVARVCAAKKVTSGIFCGNAEAAKARIGEGFRLIAMGTDALWLSGAASAALNAVRA